MSFALVSSILYREVCCKMQAPRLIVDGERGNFAFLGITSRQEARDGDGTSGNDEEVVDTELSPNFRISLSTATCVDAIEFVSRSWRAGHTCDEGKIRSCDEKQGRATTVRQCAPGKTSHLQHYHWARYFIGFSNRCLGYQRACESSEQHDRNRHGLIDKRSPCVFGHLG